MVCQEHIPALGEEGEDRAEVAGASTVSVSFELLQCPQVEILFVPVGKQRHREKKALRKVPSKGLEV